jgi:iron complex outermembrane receptor protein
LPAATPVGVCFQSANAGFNYWSYAVGARYELGDHANLYAKYDKGQRSGGLDDSPTTIDPFVPEVLGSLEVGAKLELFERRVTTNVALFSAQITNLQRSVRLLDPSGSPYTSVFNAAKGSVKGVEVEANIRPAAGFMFAGSLGLIDDDYKVFFDRTNGADLSNRKFPSTADVTYSLSGSYEAALTKETEFMVRADYSYRSKEFFETFNNALASQKAYSVLNARAHVNFVGLVSGVDLTIAAYGKNLTNKKYLVYGSNSGIIPTDQPRSYGIELRAAF